MFDARSMVMLALGRDRRELRSFFDSDVGLSTQERALVEAHKDWIPLDMAMASNATHGYAKGLARSSVDGGLWM